MVVSSPSQPVDCTIDFDARNIAGKVAVITGGQYQISNFDAVPMADQVLWLTGASGIGEAYVRALADTGYVNPQVHQTLQFKLMANTESKYVSATETYIVASNSPLSFPGTFDSRGTYIHR